MTRSFESDATNAGSHDDAEWFAPIFARTRTFHHPTAPVAYDCVKVIIVRDGSVILYSEFGQRPVTVGDAVLLGPNVLCGAMPEGHVTVTTIYADTDYLIDQVFWQHVDLLHDRLDAQHLAETMYVEPAQILRLGEDRAGILMPWLDELARLSVEGDYVPRFNRVQALWFSVADVITPFVKVSPIRLTPTQRARTRPTLPRHLPGRGFHLVSVTPISQLSLSVIVTGGSARDYRRTGSHRSGIRSNLQRLAGAGGLG